MKACHDGTLHQQEVVFDTDLSAVAVVATSGGYPLSYPKGLPITGQSTYLFLFSRVLECR